MESLLQSTFRSQVQDTKSESLAPKDFTAPGPDQQPAGEPEGPIGPEQTWGPGIRAACRPVWMGGHRCPPEARGIGAGGGGGVPGLPALCTIGAKMS